MHHVQKPLRYASFRFSHLCHTASITKSTAQFRKGSTAGGLETPPITKKVVVTSRAFPETLNMLKAASLEVVVNTHDEPWPADVLLHHASDANAMLCFMTDTVDAAFLAKCPQLELIACALKGFDNFDINACTARGVRITYVPGLLTEPTAELAVGLIIGASRNVLSGDQCVRSGKFEGWRPVLYGRGLHKATVGIWGFGAVGQAIAARLAGFGCAEIRINDVVTRSAEAQSLGCVEVSMMDVLRSDIVVAATPLDKSTYHGIGHQQIQECMSSETLLVNISRGSVVDERAVADALHSGALGGYAADVFEFEDWALEDRPLSTCTELLSAPNTLFTPHLGSAVVEVRRAIECSAASTIV